MERVYIFGAGGTGKSLLKKVLQEYEVIGFLDNDKSKVAKKIEGYEVYGDSKVLSVINAEFDFIVIATLTGYRKIKEELLEMGISESKILTRYVEFPIVSRETFLENYADMYLKKNTTNFSVAEGGVFQGEFAKRINEVFPTSKLYLFDTFEGFDFRDIEYEFEKSYSNQAVGHLNITNEKSVLQKMKHLEQVIIRKGYFPETTIGLEAETFGFVNLDFDLYKPILEGLRFFYPRMEKGAVILVHDYYNEEYLGVKKAIHDFETELETNLILLPIGDNYSVAVIKN